jgi:hypothetical protein
MDAGLVQVNAVFNKIDVIIVNNRLKVISPMRTNVVTLSQGISEYGIRDSNPISQGNFYKIQKRCTSLYISLSVINLGWAYAMKLEPKLYILS